MTRAQIQTLIDNSIGGVAEIPAGSHGTHSLDGPLKLKNHTTLKGWQAVDILEIAVGPAVEWEDQSGDYVDSPTLQGFTLRTTTSGSAIGFSATATNESTRIRMVNVTIDVHGVGLDFRKAGNNMAYDVRLERIRFARCNGMGIVGPLHNLLIDGLWFRNVTRAGAVVNTAVLYLHGADAGGGGSGQIINSTIEPTMGCPILKTDNFDLSWTNNHNESNDDTTDGVLYQIWLNNSRVVADHFYFVSPLQPVYLSGGTELTFTRTLDRQDGLGGVGPVSDCYLSDGHADNRLFFPPLNRSWFSSAGAGAIMGGDEQTVYYSGASAVSFWARDENGDVWDGAAFVAPVDVDVPDYRITANPLGGGLYGPDAIPAGTSLMELRKDAATVALSHRYGKRTIGLSDEEKLDVAVAVLDPQTTEHDDPGSVGEAIAIGGDGSGAPITVEMNTIEGE